jgi:hypothetical protein
MSPSRSPAAAESRCNHRQPPDSVPSLHAANHRRGSSASTCSAASSTSTAAPPEPHRPLAFFPPNRLRTLLLHRTETDTARSRGAGSWSGRPAPAADTPAATVAPGRRAPSYPVSSPPARRSPWPASSETPKNARIRARRLPQWITPVTAHTGAARRGRRRPQRRAGHPHHPRDDLDRQPLRPVQRADLRPVLHGQHTPSSSRP